MSDRAAFVLPVAVILAGCVSEKPALAPQSVTPVSTMQRVAKQVQACWFKPKLKAFRPYKLAAELDSYSGKPRILLVPRNRPAGLPVLVAQAEKRAGQSQFTSFGPLLKGVKGAAYAASLNAWARGSTTC